MVQCLNDCQRPGKQPASDFVDMGDTTPSRILNLAIKKRRELVDQQKEPDLCRELLNKALIHQLCKQLGERRSKKHERRSASKRRNQSFDDDESQSKRVHFEENDGEPNLLVDDLDQQGDSFYNQHSFVEDDMSATAICSSTMVQIENSLDYSQMEEFLDNDQSLDGYVAHWTEEESILKDTIAEEKAEFTHPFQSSLNILQPTLPSCSEDDLMNDVINPEDPLEMDALFRNLYRVIDPQQETSFGFCKASDAIARDDLFGQICSVI
jgi:hypothetical protein